MHANHPNRTGVIGPILEHKLQAELDVSWIIARTEHLPELIVRAAIQAVSDVGTSKIVAEKFTPVLRVVEGVQELSAELSPEPFGHVEALCKREINVLGCALAQLRHALRFITVYQRSRSGECVRVNPVAG